MVWRFDRFARSVSHLLRALEEFRSLGIEFISLSEHAPLTGETIRAGCGWSRKTRLACLMSVIAIFHQLTSHRSNMGHWKRMIH